MGTNNLVARNDGDIIQSSDPNQYREALSGDLVPRNSAGVPTNEAGDLGTSSLKWDNAYISITNTNLVQPDSGNLIVNSGGSLNITTSGTDDISIVSPQKMNVNVNHISLTKAGDGGTISTPTGGAMVFDSGLNYQASGNGSTTIRAAGVGSAIMSTVNGALALERNGVTCFNIAGSVTTLKAPGASNSSGVTASVSSLLFNAPGGTRASLSNTVFSINAGVEFRPQDVYDSTTGLSANVRVDTNGRLRRSTSSKRYKKNIRDLDKNEILKLRPVVFDDKNNENVKDQIGLIAEEVNEVEPRLAVKNEKGVVEGVNYQSIGVMLIPIVKELTEKIAKLEAKIEAMS